MDEFLHKAKEFGLPAVAAGDSEEIAEASAAMFTGRIRGLEIARRLGRDVGEVPPEWHRTADVLKSRPGMTITEDVPDTRTGVFPVFHCSQEIPCNPCTSICPNHGIVIEGDEILGLPEFVGDACDGCEKCVAICPGLAITLVDYRKDAENPTVVIPYEFSAKQIKKGDTVTVLDCEGVRARQRRGDAGQGAQGRGPRAPRARVGAGLTSRRASRASGCRSRGRPSRRRPGSTRSATTRSCAGASG